jgi:hypothetical protein
VAITFESPGDEPYPAEPPDGSDIPPEQMAWGVEWWDLAAEDVHEVIAWADQKAGPDLIYTLYVRIADGTGSGSDLLVHIAGANPTHNPLFVDGFLRQHPLR